MNNQEKSNLYSYFKRRIKQREEIRHKVHYYIHTHTGVIKTVKKTYLVMRLNNEQDIRINFNNIILSSLESF
jgi:hypothetical protein